MSMEKNKTEIQRQNNDVEIMKLELIHNRRRLSPEQTSLRQPNFSIPAFLLLCTRSLLKTYKVDILCLACRLHLTTLSHSFCLAVFYTSTK